MRTTQDISAIIRWFKVAQIPALELFDGPATLKLRQSPRIAARPSERPADDGACAVAPNVPPASKAICAPAFGRVRLSGDGDPSPLASLGSRVARDTVVALIECDELLLPATAQSECRIAAVLVAPGELVGWGQPLFEIVD